MQVIALKFAASLLALVWASVANQNRWGLTVVAFLCITAVALGWSAVNNIVRGQ